MKQAVTVAIGLAAVSGTALSADEPQRRTQIKFSAGPRGDRVHGTVKANGDVVFGVVRAKTQRSQTRSTASASRRGTHVQSSAGRRWLAPNFGPRYKAIPVYAWGTKTQLGWQRELARSNTISVSMQPEHFRQVQYPTYPPPTVTAPPAPGRR